MAESVDAVVSLLRGGAVRPEMFLLHDPTSGEPHLEARLTVEPDTALAALRGYWRNEP